MNLKKEVFLNQNCAEMMIKKAAQLILRSDLDFEYTRGIQDIQVDLGPAFMFSPDEEKTLWVSGKNQETLEKDLATLNKSSVYFFGLVLKEGLVIGKSCTMRLRNQVGLVIHLNPITFK